jgi:hypothetical protein
MSEVKLWTLSQRVQTQYNNHSSIRYYYHQLPPKIIYSLQLSPSLLFYGPEGRPNNLPQPAWRLAKLFFWLDMSWSRADLCANSYVISTRFSLLSKLPLCMHYISYVGIEHIIHNLLFRIIRNMLFVELGPTGFQVTCNCTYFSIFE